ncbi:3-oxoacyl-[acyl-carrier-protein] synthase III C-terminal domain-containing protein [Streptomyces adustus]|uniref:3-oxoacyl-[acyl-carrier-protein] synthase III C-terminal domain-containing protein n=1 Tax=Streptomyces adustus TaxID=1609272 RepID=UPI0035E1399D
MIRPRRCSAQDASAATGERDPGLPPNGTLDTFEDYGNLFGAAIPVTLDRATRSRQVEDGALVVLGGFAHAGDFAGAVAVRWHGGRR